MDFEDGKPEATIELRPAMKAVDLVTALTRMDQASPDILAEDRLIEEGSVRLMAGKPVGIVGADGFTGAGGYLMVRSVPGPEGAGFVGAVEIRSFPPPSRDEWPAADHPFISVAHVRADKLVGAVRRALRAQTATVYGLMHPRTRALLDITQDGFLVSRSLAATYVGGQDGCQEPFLDLAREWYRKGQVDLAPEAFPVAHVTAGASDALEKLLCPPYRALHVFRGEYEGAGHIAASFGMAVMHHVRDQPLDTGWFGSAGVFYLSAPWAADGEYWDGLEAFLRDLHERAPHVDVVIDITYVGLVKTTRPLPLATFPNVKAVVFSLSKPFGIYYLRVGGAFLRGPRPRFGGADWFKCVPAIHLATPLLAHSEGPTALPLRWADAQREALEIHKRCGLLAADAVAANAVLLATGPTAPPNRESAGGPSVSERVLGGGRSVFRACLSPTMDRIVNPADADGVSR